MFQQILSGTPIFVWGILAFLIFRGVLASADRETSLRKVFIIPVVMLALSVQGIIGSFGAGAIAFAAWSCALAAGSVLAWFMFAANSVRAIPQRGVVFQRGSWVPMMLMLGIFFTKYAVGVTLALHAAYRQDTAFVAAVCALYGLFNGIFLGKLMRTLALYRRVQAVLQPGAVVLA